MTAAGPVCQRPWIVVVKRVTQPQLIKDSLKHAAVLDKAAVMKKAQTKFRLRKAKFDETAPWLEHALDVVLGMKRSYLLVEAEVEHVAA